MGKLWRDFTWGLVVIFGLFLTMQSSQAEPLHLKLLRLNPQVPIQPIYDHAAFFRGSSENAGFPLNLKNGELAKGFETLFFPQGKVPQMPATQDAIWLVVQIENPFESEEDLVVFYDYGAVQNVTFFLPTPDDRLIELKAGNAMPLLERALPTMIPAFPVRISPRTTVTYFMRVLHPGIMNFPVFITSRSHFFKWYTGQERFLVFLFGILLAMLVYNLIVGILTGDIKYLIYVASGASFFVYYLAVSGLGSMQFWTDSSWIAHGGLFAFRGAGSAFTSLFIIHFLDLRKFSRGYWLLAWASITLGVVEVLISKFLPYPATMAFAQANGLFSIVVNLSTGVYVSLRDRGLGLSFTIPWTIFMVFTAIYLAWSKGLLPTTTFTKHSMIIGQTAENLLLALALSYRIKLFRQRQIALEKSHAIELETKNAQLREIDRLKDEFLATTSHELRTPLHGIIGIAESLIDGAKGNLPPPIAEDLALINLSGRRLNSLVNDILDFSKLKHKSLDLNKKALPIRQLFDVVLWMHKPSLEKKSLSLNWDMAHDLPLVLGDENRLEQVLHNIVGNAVKFTAKGGITIGARMDEGTLLIWVKDTGIGIPADKTESIFNSFEQLDSSDGRFYGETGLGLAISRKLIDLHGGRIWVESHIGQGSTFFFTLPLAPISTPKADLQVRCHYETAPGQKLLATNFEEEAQHQVDPTQISKEQKSGATILVVDDEPINLQVASNALQIDGHIVVQATSGQEVFEWIKNRPKPDLILLDVMMPGMTGFEVCKTLRQTYTASELPIILLTAKNQMRDLVNGFDCGANDYLLKPFSRTELSSRVRALVDLKVATERFVAQQTEVARVEKDMEAAKAVQEALLPDALAIPEVEISSHYQSAEQTGGDWFDLRVDQAQRRLYILIGDVTGHGIPSALVTAVVCGAIHANWPVCEKQEQKPKPETMNSVLEKMAQKADLAIRQVGSRSRRLMTMGFLGIDLDTGKAIYLNRGHCPILLRKQEKVSQVNVMGMPLGEAWGLSSDGSASFKEIQLNPGDILILYTDGLIENEGPDQKVFTAKALRKLLETSTGTAADVKNSILNQAKNIWQDTRPIDDCTLLVLRWHGPTQMITPQAI